MRKWIWLTLNCEFLAMNSLILGSIGGKKSLLGIVVDEALIYLVIG